MLIGKSLEQKVAQNYLHLQQVQDHYLYQHHPHLVESIIIDGFIFSDMNIMIFQLSGHDWWVRQRVPRD